jgi:hypothetical protein
MYLRLICREIKTRTLDPKVAYKQITTDWVAYYLELNRRLKAKVKMTTSTNIRGRLESIHRYRVLFAKDHFDEV